MEQDQTIADLPLFMDFVIEVPEHVRIEQGIGKDCVTWGEGGCDDD